jgi:hypothetical protein
MQLFIVERDSADGPELDVFTNEQLADEWAQFIGETVITENTIDRDTLDAMKQSYPG